MGLFDDLFGPAQPIPDKPVPVDADKALNDCFRQTLDGQHAFEITQPTHPEIRYYGQLSSEDDKHKAAWLVVDACPYEAAVWDEKCRASGIDAIACVSKSSDVAEQFIRQFPGP